MATPFAIFDKNQPLALHAQKYSAPMLAELLSKLDARPFVDEPTKQLISHGRSNGGRVSSQSAQER